MINGGLDLPMGSFIIKHNSDIPAGKALFSDASAKIPEMKGAKSITLIETSENLYDATDNLINSLGYSNFKDMNARGTNSNRALINIMNNAKKLQELFEEVGNDMDNFFKKLGIKNIEQFTSEKNIENNKRYIQDTQKNWQKFCEKLGLVNSAHSLTVFSKIENIIDAVAELSEYSNKWEYNGKNLQEIIQQAIEVNKSRIIPNKKLVVDLDILSNVIKQSKTPNEARKLILEKFNIKDNLLINKEFASDREKLKGGIEHFLSSIFTFEDEFVDSWIF